ncbi:MAG: ABC transporter ATP-binding protein [Nitrospinae bacterium]|nr:ABC transporter ATP-binding protein [Nitrospinota bacterium]
MAKIEYKAVEKSFGVNHVLRGVDFQVPSGRITAIIGRSGEGKSVLLKHSLGLLRPDRGEILVDGDDISKMGGKKLNEARSKFGMLFQGAALFDSMTVEENVAFPLVEHSTLTRPEITERVKETLHLVGLDGVESRMPSQLSGGMKKRVGLARAIIREPEIILYDEPTTGLDPILTDSIHRLIIQMQEVLQVTSLMISHDVEKVLEFAHYIGMLHGGTMVFAGSPDEVRASEDPLVKQFIAGSSEGPIEVL